LRFGPIQWEKLQGAQGLGFIAPVFRLHLPAVLMAIPYQSRLADR